ncbi:MAG: nucleotidyltransferase family protein [Rubrivivax sp.]|nr:MAG: nucleotidyltransferase family protein [Rubrivivax sp.]
MGQPCGVLLAAGVGRRFTQAQPDAGDKLMQTLPDGRPVALAALRTLLAALPRVVAVVRPGAHALADALRAEGAEVIVWPPMPPDSRMGAHQMPEGRDSGMGASLACAVRATPNASAWVIALADMPGVRADTLQRVVHAVDSDASAIAAPAYRGQRGHPVGFGWAHAPALRALRGDRGARDILLAQAGQLVLLEVDDPGIVADVDTPADLARFIEARA